jgi:energy-coupling factor transporter ATP-binding protein EcfA2
MLTRLYADNFACFVNFEFRPNRTSLLVGDNGSGKTSIFEVLARIRGLTRLGGVVEEVFPAPDRTAWQKRPIQTFEMGADPMLHHAASRSC